MDSRDDSEDDPAPVKIGPEFRRASMVAFIPFDRPVFDFSAYPSLWTNEYRLKNKE